MDRIHATTIPAAPPSSDPDMDAALRRALAAPSPARQLLEHIADRLGTRQHGHLPVTGTMWQDATMAAYRSTLAGRCEHVANSALVRAFAALPPLRDNETRGEYALRLRAAARGL